MPDVDVVHRGHDTLLIARHAAGDLAPSEVAEADARIRDCEACAALSADLASLRVALASLPRAATSPRDFRISPAQAARLRGGSWWRRLVRSIAAPRGVGRPLATAFTTLGLVGLLIGSLPAGVLPLAAVTGDRAATTESTHGSTAAPPAPTSSPGNAGGAYQPAAQGTDGRTNTDSEGPVFGSSDAPKTDLGGDVGAGSQTERDVAAAVSPMSALALVLLAIGLGLFAVRRFGRQPA